MLLFYKNFFIIASFLVVSIAIALIILGLSYRVSRTSSDLEKLSTYECGFDPYEDARNHFDVQFYLVAILFLIFDLETAFFFPWTTSVSFLTANSFFCMVDFIFELLAGFIYAWLVGALEWS